MLNLLWLLLFWFLLKGYLPVVPAGTTGAVLVRAKQGGGTTRLVLLPVALGGDAIYRCLGTSVTLVLGS